MTYKPVDLDFLPITGYTCTNEVYHIVLNGLSDNVSSRRLSHGMHVIVNVEMGVSVHFARLTWSNADATIS